MIPEGIEYGGSVSGMGTGQVLRGATDVDDHFTENDPNRRHHVYS